MTNQIPNIKNQTKFNLEPRTAEFGEKILDFTKSIKQNQINNILIRQIVKSGTSIGANYYEANESNSKKDFYHKIGIAKKKAKETMYWLRMINRVEPDEKKKISILWKEAHELVLIFSSIQSKK